MRQRSFTQLQSEVSEHWVLRIAKLNQMAIDTATPAGRRMMQIVGSFAEFERAMLREHTKSGLEAARKEGRVVDDALNFRLISKER